MFLRRFPDSLLLVVTLILGACGGDESVGENSSSGRDTSDRIPSRPGTPDAEESAEDTSTDDLDDTSVVDDTSTPGACTPGSTTCVSLDTIRTCNAEGTATSDAACGEGSYCLTDGGGCVPSLCRPGSLRCVSTTEREQCAADGSVYLPGPTCAAGEYCDEGDCRSSACLASVMFLFDGSSSMTGEFANVQASINAVTAANPDVAFGLSMFPTGLGCSIGDGRGGLFGPGVEWPDVPIAATGASDIAAWFSANDASGGATPLISALEWFAENVDAVWAIPENGHLIVMTEGADTCRCDEDRFGNIEEECITDPLTAATASLVAQGVKVYVIGYRFSEAPSILNAIAANGGTSLTEFIYAGNEESLTDAFELVVTEAKLCN